MKKMFFNGDEFEAEKIIKGDTYIIGKDINDKTIFSFKGISNFELFTLEEGQEFDIQGPTTEEKLEATQKELLETQRLLEETRAAVVSSSSDFQNFMDYALSKLPN